MQIDWLRVCSNTFIPCALKMRSCLIKDQQGRCRSRMLPGSTTQFGLAHLADALPGAISGVVVAARGPTRKEISDSITGAADPYLVPEWDVQQVARPGGLIVQVDCRSRAKLAGRLDDYHEVDHVLSACVPYDRARNPLPLSPPKAGLVTRRGRVTRS